MQQHNNTLHGIKGFVTLRVCVFVEYMAIDLLKYASVPDPSGGPREYAPHGYMGLMAG